MEKRMITLGELETEARLKEEEKVAEAEACARAEAKAQKKAESDLAGDMADWLAVMCGLDPASVLSRLNVSLNPWGNMASCVLTLNRHVPITWDVAVGKEGLEMQGRNPYSYGGYDKRASTLAEALLRSADAYNELAQRQAECEKREEEETASWEAHQRKRADQGQHYLDLIASYPVLGSILEMLAVYIGQQEEYENSIAAAEGYSEEIAAQMAAKMRTAQAQARELADEVGRAKSAQREAEERARRNQRSYPHDLCRA